MDEPTREPESLVSIPTAAVEAEQVAYGRVAPDDALLLPGLRRGNESAFAILIEQYHAPMTRLARLYVPNPVVAEEVVQEAWLAVVRGLSGFKERCSLKTWIFRILINIAITRGQHERRSVPFSSLAGGEGESFEPAFDGDGAWITSPGNWGDDPEERLLTQETLGCIRASVEVLPPRQREVIILRDIEGWTAGEVSELLELSEGNQRVLLHRARSRVRHALGQYFHEEGRG